MFSMGFLLFYFAFLGFNIITGRIIGEGMIMGTNKIAGRLIVRKNYNSMGREGK